MKNLFVYLVAFTLAFSIPVVTPLSNSIAEASTAYAKIGKRRYTEAEIKGLERGLGRAEEDTADAKKARARANRDFQEADGEYEAAQSALRRFESDNNARNSTGRAKLTPELKAELSSLEADVAEERSKRNTRQNILDESDEDYKSMGRREEIASDKLEVAEANRKDCDECDDDEDEDEDDDGKKGGWNTFAQTLMAGTPLILGGLGAVLGIRAQKDNYKLYNKSCTGLGLPCYPPQGYGGVLGATIGPAMWSLAAMSGAGGYGAMGGMPDYNGYYGMGGMGSMMGGFGGRWWFRRWIWWRLRRRRWFRR